MSRLIYINGAPGVGKLTIARNMAHRLNARVLDNHAIYNVGFALTDFRSTAFYETARAVKTIAHERILSLPNGETVILTAADFADNDWGHENWQAIEQLARDRDWPLFVICLRCAPAEHRIRIAGADREQHGKLRDPEAVNRLGKRAAQHLFRCYTSSCRRRGGAVRRLGHPQG
jgi:predicted kinase